MELDDDLPYRAALVPQVEDLGLERFVLVDVGHLALSLKIFSDKSFEFCLEDGFFVRFAFLE